MIRVSAYEAKTHLAELLKKVRNGGRVLITKHQVSVATLDKKLQVAANDARVSVVNF